MEKVVGQTQTASKPQTVQVPNYSGVNIQIFNPSVAAPGANAPAANINSTTYCSNTGQSYPPNYYTQNFAQPAQPEPVEPVKPVESDGKKTETREVVELTDNYIKTLENYLNNSSNKEIRLMGAKEVLARFQEDSNRKNDPALNALVNKMLQDPCEPIKFIAMGILESRAATGNQKSFELLQKIQQQKTKNGHDELKASKALLKMSGNTVKKEFEV